MDADDDDEDYDYKGGKALDAASSAAKGNAPTTRKRARASLEGKDSTTHSHSLLAEFHDQTARVRLILAGMEIHAAKELDNVEALQASAAAITRVGHDGNQYYCQVCKGFGDVVCCDGCPKVYHLKCLPGGLADADDDPWFCPDCRKKGKGGDTLHSKAKDDAADAAGTACTGCGNTTQQSQDQEKDKTGKATTSGSGKAKSKQGKGTLSSSGPGSNKEKGSSGGKHGKANEKDTVQKEKGKSSSKANASSSSSSGSAPSTPSSTKEKKSKATANAGKVEELDKDEGGRSLTPTIRPIRKARKRSLGSRSDMDNDGDSPTDTAGAALGGEGPTSRGKTKEEGGVSSTKAKGKKDGSSRVPSTPDTAKSSTNVGGSAATSTPSAGPTKRRSKSIDSTTGSKKKKRKKLLKSTDKTKGTSNTGAGTPGSPTSSTTSGKTKKDASLSPAAVKSLTTTAMTPTSSKKKKKKKAVVEEPVVTKKKKKKRHKDPKGDITSNGHDALGSSTSSKSKNKK